MTRLAQAMEWANNQIKKGKKIYVNKMPRRHRDVLVKHEKVLFHYGVNPNEDYYTLRS